MFRLISTRAEKARPPMTQKAPMATAEDRQYMGTAHDAAEALKAKAREWRDVRQPLIATPGVHRAREVRDHQLRFEIANAVLLWLWHQENPETETAN